GTVTLCRRHARDRRQLVVSIADTDRWLLAHALDRAGTGKITSKKTTADHHTPSFTFTISNSQAPALVRQVAAFRRPPKAERAKLALTRYTLAVSRNGKHDAKRELIRRGFEAEFFSISAARHRRDPREEGSSR